MLIDMTRKQNFVGDRIVIGGVIGVENIDGPCEFPKGEVMFPSPSSRNIDGSSA